MLLDIFEIEDKKLVDVAKGGFCNKVKTLMLEKQQLVMDPHASIVLREEERGTSFGEGGWDE